MGQLIPPLTPEQQPLRHEQKYYISPGDAQYLSLLLRRTMQTDPHANARNEYHIRSLYFDDCFNSAMSDKLDGVMHRHKYRIRIYNFSDKIIRDAIDDPADVPQIRKFLDFYLPTTIRLLNAYDRMSAQEFGGENITGSMQRIEEMLDTTIAAYKKQLDALFANQAADIQMDIDTMNTMLAREGLGGKGYLDIKDFMKQYEQQQSAAEAAPAPASDTSSEQTMKGSTSHG